MFASNVAGVLVAESVVLWGIWIFFLVTAALVTVCSRPSPFSVILNTFSYSTNFLTSNGAEVLINAAFSRLSKPSLGFAGAF